MTGGRDVDDLIAQSRKILHDINQPLTVILARSELLLLKITEEDPNYKAVDQMREQAEKMYSLVEDLRNLMMDFQQG